VERDKTIAVYTEMIRLNNANIQRLIALSAARKNTFDGYARYKLAAAISALNAQYANVVAQAGGPPTASLNLTSADALNLEAAEIVKNISVAVTVKGDRDNRVRDAFARVLANEGLRTRGNNPPYTLDITVNLSEVVFPNSSHKFCRYTVSAELIENATKSVLLPFSITDRAGHSTYEEAVNTAIIQVERLIGERYPAAFREYLAALLPI
jgi:hypothetical protein